MKKRIIAIIAALSFMVSILAVPSFADSATDYMTWAQKIPYYVFGGDTTLSGNLLAALIKYNNASTSGAVPKYGNSGATTSGSTHNYVYNTTSSSSSSSTTTTSYKAINTTNNTWYNPVTNNYTTYNDITYNNTYNTYNVTNNEYNTYITNNYTYVSYYIQNTETGDSDYVEVYYVLPDGRNTYDLKPEDVWGQYFCYDVYNYDKVFEDDGQTLGLWHLDGDFKDSSAAAGTISLTSSLTSFLAVDDSFGSGLSYSAVAAGTSPTLCKLSSLPGVFSIEFRIFVSSSSRSSLSMKTGASGILNGYTSYLSAYTILTNQWNSISVMYDGSFYHIGVNGYISNYTGTYDGAFDTVFSPTISLESGERVTIDEVRLSNKVLYSSDYVASLQPFDTNSVLCLPASGAEGDIAVKSSIPIDGQYRIGGARPTYPTNGYCYVSLENNVVQSVRQYQGDGWYSVDASIYIDGSWHDLKNYDMSTLTFQ